MTKKQTTVIPFQQRGTATTPRNEKGKFVKGAPKPQTAGRARGKRNKMTVRLKECILEAATLSGQDGKGKNGATGYLVWLSRSEPAVFGRMLEKLLPLQVDVEDKTNRMLTVEEAVQRLKDRNLPIPASLSDLLPPSVDNDDAKVFEPDDFDTMYDRPLPLPAPDEDDEQ